MMNPRYRPLVIGTIAVLVAWAVVVVGFRIADHLKWTPEKMSAALHATDLEKLSAEARAKRLEDLAAKLNSLGAEDRRRARADRDWDRLWRQMTEAEKTDFVDRTMPTGVKQMLTAFEQLSEDRRRYAVTNAIARMRDRQERGDPGSGEGSNREPLSEELQKRIVATGLKTFYSQSSAQTKAEVAPLLEEMQRMMESGKFFRR